MWVVLNLSYLGFVDKALTQVGGSSPHFSPSALTAPLFLPGTLLCVLGMRGTTTLFVSNALFIFMIWISALCSGRSQSTHY